MRIVLIAGVLTASLAPAPSLAHGGGLNAEGCHNQRSTGSYHCHRSAAPAALLQQVQPLSSDGFAFPNCDAARAAGYANIRVGEYGYGTHLDRDRDGVGCES